MKWFLLFLILILSVLSKGQTYSRIHDIIPNAEGNYLKDAIIADTNIFTILSQFCVTDAGLSQCAVFTKFGLTGDILKRNINDSILTLFGGTECLKLYDGQLYHSTTQNGDLERMTYLYEYDLELNFKNIKSYSRLDITSNITNEGVHFTGENIYLYGSVQNDADTPDSMQLIKTDIEGNEIWRKYYSYGNSRLNVNSVQTTVDGNLAFILSLKSPAGANKGFNGYQLMKIDTSGAILDSLIIDEFPEQPLRLLSISDGSYVFGTEHHPFDGVDIFTTGYGLINKLNSDFDTLAWSLPLPHNQLIDGRHYRMWDYKEASNGDIIACGMARDNTDTELATGVPDKNSTWNGFIVRITADGEIVWLRLYKTPNDLLPHDEFGRFRPSRLNKIHELPDGRFIAAGDVFVNNSQNSALLNQGIEANHIWLLMVDENGCLDGYNCEEIIRLNQTKNLTYSIGDEWVYELQDYIGGGNSEIGYRSFAIQDTFFDGTRTKYVLNAQDTFYVDNNKMYFWDEYYQEYIKYFDWQETASYDIKYYDPFRNTDEIATVVIDSISFKHFGDDSLQVQHVHILNSGTLEEGYTDVVYEGIGAGYYGIKFLLGCGFCDDNPVTADLRCFTNDSMTYQFVPYACDSIFFTTSIVEQVPTQIKIFPNPNSGKLHIEGILQDTEYRIRDLSGRIIQEGMTRGYTIDITTNGMAILELKEGQHWIQRKIIRIN